MSEIDRMIHPAKTLLLHAEQAIAAKPLAAHLLVVTAIGAAALEALACAAATVVLTLVGWSRTAVCLLLRGTSLVAWALIAYLSNVTLDKSAIRWIQFIALQALLGYANPRNWWAQWKLWAGVLHGMGSFAVSCASMADRLELSINRVAGWEQLSNQSSRCGALVFFGLYASLSAWNPTRVIEKYKQVVEELPEWRPLGERVKRCLHRNRGLMVTVGLMGLGLLAHLYGPGYKGRMDKVDLLAQRLWSVATIASQAVVVAGAAVLDHTVRPIWHYWTRGIDYDAFNQVLYDFRDGKLKVKR